MHKVLDKYETGLNNSRSKSICFFMQVLPDSISKTCHILELQQINTNIFSVPVHLYNFYCNFKIVRVFCTKLSYKSLLGQVIFQEFIVHIKVIFWKVTVLYIKIIV